MNRTDRTVKVLMNRKVKVLVNRTHRTIKVLMNRTVKLWLDQPTEPVLTHSKVMANFGPDQNCTRRNLHHPFTTRRSWAEPQNHSGPGRASPPQLIINSPCSFSRWSSPSFRSCLSSGRHQTESLFSLLGPPSSLGSGRSYSQLKACVEYCYWTFPSWLVRSWRGAWGYSIWIGWVDH